MKLTTSAMCSFKNSQGRNCPNSQQIDDYCILHSPVEGKIAESFKQAFEDEICRQKALKQPVLDIEGFVVPIPFSWHKYGKSFQGINAKNTIFTSNVDFWQSDIAKNGLFEKAKFYKSADFSGADFKEQVTFRGAQFFGESFFINANFGASADFSEAHFNANVTFRRTDFSSHVFFTKTLFDAQVDFEQATLSSFAVFDDATIGGDANFSETKFNDTVRLCGVKLGKAADFHNALFKKSIDLSRGTVEYANFRGARFEGECDFSSLTLGKGSFNQDTKVNSKITFEYAELGRSVFSRVRLPQDTSFKWASVEEIEFYDCNLEQALFVNARGLRTCRFNNVQWATADALPQKVFKNKNRWVLADEIVLRGESRTEEGLHEVERAYRQLKANFEDDKNFPDAGHFHYGEMEMKRLSKSGPLRRSFGSLIGWYWLLSGYGESSQRAFFWCVAVIFCSALLLAGGGFVEKAAFGNTGNEQIRIGFHLAKGLAYNARTFWHGLIFSFKVAFLRTDGFSQSLSLLTNIGVFFETLMGPLTIALLGLALQRTFKRN